MYYTQIMVKLTTCWLYTCVWSACADEYCLCLRDMSHAIEVACTACRGQTNTHNHQSGQLHLKKFVLYYFVGSTHYKKYMGEQGYSCFVLVLKHTVPVWWLNPHFIKVGEIIAIALEWTTPLKLTVLQQSQDKWQMMCVHLCGLVSRGE